MKGTIYQNPVKQQVIVPCKNISVSFFHSPFPLAQSFNHHLLVFIRQVLKSIDAKMQTYNTVNWQELIFLVMFYQ